MKTESQTRRYRRFRSGGSLNLVLQRMRTYLALLLGVALATPLFAQADKMYVFFRHGEKPDNNSGQLTCKGLNRALSLPPVLLGRYGEPDKLYTSAPYQEKTGSSLRPLLTMTPVAIRVSKPIILRYHADQTRKLTNALLKEDKAAVTYIAWEHKNLVIAARRLVAKAGGDPTKVPFWIPTDFDSIYVVRLDDKNHFKSFTLESEGLNGVSGQCPAAMSTGTGGSVVE